MEENQLSASKQYDSYKGKDHYNKREINELNIIVQAKWFIIDRILRSLLLLYDIVFETNLFALFSCTVPKPEE